jgi:hypothetical protein
VIPPVIIFVVINAFYMFYVAYVRHLYTWKISEDIDPTEESYRENRSVLSAPEISSPSSREYPDVNVRLSSSISAASLESSGSDPREEKQSTKKREGLTRLEVQTSTVRSYPGMN